MAHARQTTLFGGWTNEQPTTSQTADDDWGKSSKSGVADTSSATQANIWSVCLHRAVLCVLIVVCRDCVKAAGSEFRRIKKEHPGGVAAWLQEQSEYVSRHHQALTLSLTLTLTLGQTLRVTGGIWKVSTNRVKG